MEDYGFIHRNNTKWWTAHIILYIYSWNANDPSFVGKDLVVEWPRLKIEHNQVPGTVYIFIKFYKYELLGITGHIYDASKSKLSVIIFALANANANACSWWVIFSTLQCKCLVCPLHCSSFRLPHAQIGNLLVQTREIFAWIILTPWKPMMYIHKIPLKFGVCQKNAALYWVHVTGNGHDVCLHIVYYDVLCCLWMLMAAYGSVLQIFHG